jgi:hypothetical protein
VSGRKDLLKVVIDVRWEVMVDLRQEVSLRARDEKLALLKGFLYQRPRMLTSYIIGERASRFPVAFGQI